MICHSDPGIQQAIFAPFLLRCFSFSNILLVLICYAKIKFLSDILNNFIPFPWASWKDTFYPIHCTVPCAFAFEIRRATKRRSMGNAVELFCIVWFTLHIYRCLITSAKRDANAQTLNDTAFNR